MRQSLVFSGASSFCARWYLPWRKTSR